MLKSSTWEARYPNQRAAKDADDAEFGAILRGVCNLEEGIRDDRTAGALDDYEGPNPEEVEEWAAADTQYDSATGAVAEEIERRGSVLGSLYPFRLEGNKIAHRKSATLCYEFCLAICMAPSLSKRPYHRLPIAFERLCRDVVKCYLGPDAAALRTGWPGDRFEKRPSHFRDLVLKLHSLTGEWRWSPGYGRPEDPGPSHKKDGGLDFVVWKRMPDGRAGQLFLLGQCACGGDWNTKFNDLSIDDLRNWVRPLSVVPPLRVFAIPYHIPNAIYFDDVNQLAGLTLDRARIVLIAERPENRDTIAEAARDPFGELIRLVIPGF